MAEVADVPIKGTGARRLGLFACALIATHREFVGQASEPARPTISPANHCGLHEQAIPVERCPERPSQDRLVFVTIIGTGRLERIRGVSVEQRQLNGQCRLRKIGGGVVGGHP